jgi:hypothetical protein
MEDFDRSFIRRVYDRCGGSLDIAVDGEEIGQALGLDAAQTADVVARLIRTGFVRDVAAHFRIKITARGIAVAKQGPPSAAVPQSSAASTSTRASGPGTTRASGPGSGRPTPASTRTSTGPSPTGSKRPGRSSAWTTPSDPMGQCAPQPNSRASAEPPGGVHGTPPASVGASARRSSREPRKARPSARP